MTLLDADRETHEAVALPDLPPDAVDIAAALEDEGPLPVLRPLVASGLASLMAAVMIAGIFGSWAARLLALASVAFGVLWCLLTLRAGKRAVIFQSALPVVAVVVGAFTLLPNGGPGRFGSLIGEAVGQGRLLRPPVPFEPGWRPVLVIVLTLLAFCNAWLATALRQPRWSLFLPVPVVFLTAVSQAKSSEFLSGVVVFVLFLAAVSVLFGGDLSQATKLGAAFELRRAVRAVIGGLAIVGLLVGLNQSSLLFPEPAYNPAEQPQKPKAVPLGKVRDRVLFEIDAGPAGPGAITGPWRLGTLDVYDGTAWRLAPFDPERLQKVARDGVVDRQRAGLGDVTVKFTVRDLGSSPVLPGIAAPINIGGPRPPTLLFDPRTDTFRAATGSLEAGLRYDLTTRAYPTADDLRAVDWPTSGFSNELEVPAPPASVVALLAQAPTKPWDRLAFLRAKLNEVVVASGPGVPEDVPPSKVEDLLVGSHEGSPFEIVAAEALLARWAGVPARIGFGYDGFNDESGVKTVRPKNGSNWLEVYFEGYGWVPLLSTPPRANSNIGNDPNAKYNPNILPSEEVALDIYVPVELENLQLLYLRLRRLVLMALPFAVAALAGYLALPAAQKARRRQKRRRWARSQGPRAQIAVEYAEFRDLATDLNVGDPYNTPHQYLQTVVDDAEHAELAWLVSRTLYGDLASAAGPEDVANARAMSASLRRRMFDAQPMQVRMLAVLSRASLKQPYTTEVPQVFRIRLRRHGDDHAVRRRAQAVRKKLRRATRDVLETVGRH